MAKDARSQAVAVLRQVLQFGHSLSAELPKAIEQTDSAQIGLLQELSLGTLRQFHYLDARLRAHLKTPLKTKDTDIYCILLVAAYQLLYLDKPDYAVVSSAVELCKKRKKLWAGKLVNAILRNLLREKAADASSSELTPWQSVAHPKWIYKQVLTDWPDQADSVLATNNQQAPLVLRINRQQSDREQYANRLERAEIQFSPCRWSQSGLRLQQNLRPTDLPEFAQGAVSIQDEAAQLCSQFLQVDKLEPGSRVLDACAAPGGKTCHLLEQNPQIDCTALDIDAKRLERLDENLQRLQLDQLKIQVTAANAAELDNWWDGQAFKAILLDAPCSGTGVIRRHPDIKLLRKKADIETLIEIQQRLLLELWQTLEVGGHLLYTTCSIFKAENQLQIAKFLQQQRDAKLIPLTLSAAIDTGYGQQILPSADGPDGFFYCLLEKCAS